MKVEKKRIKKNCVILLLACVGLGIGAALAAASQSGTFELNRNIPADSLHVTAINAGRGKLHREMNFNLATHRLKDFVRELE
jgi:hypothetical protein